MEKVKLVKFRENEIPIRCAVFSFEPANDIAGKLTKLVAKFRE